MTTLIVAEHDNNQLKPNIYNIVSAGKKLGNPVSLLIAGYHCTPVVEAAEKIEGVDQILYADNPCYEHQLAENLASLIHSIREEFHFFLAPASTFGKNLMPRVAALLDVAQISDVVKILSSDTFVRPIYAGNALATIKSLDTPKVLTIRATAFDPVSRNDFQKTPIQPITEIHNLSLSRFIKTQPSLSKRPELGSATIVVSGGRALQSKENFKLIEQLADKLGAAIGASRAAVDAGFVPNDYQVGQTGKIVAPKLYIAVGISGAIQHLAGMKDSKVIVAINKDPDAPIFQIADYGLVGDLFEILPQLCEAL